LGPGLITEKNELLGLKIRCEAKGQSLARRHSDGESEGIWDGTAPMVRPELRRGYDGRPKDIASSGESRVGTPGRGVSCLRHWRPTVLGDLVPRDESEPRPSARILRK
jgi:hypothetical protein